MLINEECINCGACEPECPNDAITEGDEIYQVESAKCTECVGEYDEPQCVEVCPVDDCVAVNPALVESRDVLQARYEALRA
jgi:ferredoxin